ncbi:winged helix-turn-helix transcriptional regulator [Peribacillus simplex]
MDAESIAEHLGVSIPTAYRYLKELNNSGIIAEIQVECIFLDLKLLNLIIKSETRTRPYL